MRHRDRTAMSSFHLSKKVERCCSCHVASWYLIAPGGGMHSPGNRLLHQMMIGRVKYHCIAAVTIAIMSLQNWFVRIGIETPLDDLFASGKCANLAQAILCPVGSLTL